MTDTTNTKKPRRSKEQIAQDAVRSLHIDNHTKAARSELVDAGGELHKRDYRIALTHARNAVLNLEALCKLHAISTDVDAPVANAEATNVG